MGFYSVSHILPFGVVTNMFAVMFDNKKVFLISTDCEECAALLSDLLELQG